MSECQQVQTSPSEGKSHRPLLGRGARTCRRWAQAFAEKLSLQPPLVLSAVSWNRRARSSWESQLFKPRLFSLKNSLRNQRPRGRMRSHFLRGSHQWHSRRGARWRLQIIAWTGSGGCTARESGHWLHHGHPETLVWAHAAPLAARAWEGLREAPLPADQLLAIFSINSA